MDYMELLSVLSRWLHVAAGILWIGLLYWFNFVNIPFAGTMDGDTKKKVVPELFPRALYFFRWGAAYTWLTGLILAALVFYHGGLMFDQGVEGWGVGSYVMVAITFLVFPGYDMLAKSFGKDIRVFGAIAFVLVAVMVYLMVTFGHFSYRAYVIHTGMMFGTLMAANVWMRIWPAQKKIIGAIKEGTAPDGTLAATAMQRSRHNTYMSVPLLWTMINYHTTTTVAVEGWYYLLVVTAIGWIVVSLMYDKSAKVKGF
ncbi:MAG TPA: urate hydroxylase PuuD [Bacteroidota bacterium]|nr:urate hydroxylase PuuD [Bacteroidota bacterium]